MLDLTALETAVAADESTDSSAITVIQTLMAEVEASKGDPAAIQAIVDRVNASTSALAAAISNVPAA